MSYTVVPNPNEPARRFLMEKGWIQQRGTGGSLSPYWAQPDTGHVYIEVEAIKIAHEEDQNNG